MSERITRTQVRKLAERVSQQLPGETRVVAEGRYGYVGIDLCDEVGARRVLSTGLTARQAYDYLSAMHETLNIIGRDA